MIGSDSNPKVNVVMSVYNGEQFVQEAIESALSQTYKNFEIIIVNDGSRDNSFEKIKPYLNLSNIKYIEQSNKGIAAARNTAIKNSTGELLAFLDHDDLWLPEKLSTQVDYLNRHPDIMLVHSRQGYIDANGNRIENYEKDWVTNLEGKCLKELFLRNCIATLTVMLRKNCLDKIGLLNENLSSCDDYELWMRISRKHPVGFIDKTLALYRLHDTQASRNYFFMEKTELKALKSICHIFSGITSELGRDLVKRRLFELNYSVGNFYMWKDRNFKEARRYFVEALKNSPFHWPSLKRLLWCSLNSPQRKMLDWYSHKLKRVFSKK